MGKAREEKIIELLTEIRNLLKPANLIRDVIPSVDNTWTWPSPYTIYTTPSTVGSNSIPFGSTGHTLGYIPTDYSNLDKTVSPPSTVKNDTVYANAPQTGMTNSPRTVGWTTKICTSCYIPLGYSAVGLTQITCPNCNNTMPII